MGRGGRGGEEEAKGEERRGVAEEGSRIRADERDVSEEEDGGGRGCLLLPSFSLLLLLQLLDSFGGPLTKPQARKSKRTGRRW